jgi:Iap family predicted aminopeptidase
MSLRNEAVRSFETWLVEQHPEDQEEMYRYAGLPSLTLESIELWHRHTDEFVAEQDG